MNKKAPTDLEKLEQATAAAREATREARETLKDMRASMREFEDLIVRRADDIFERNITASLAHLDRLILREMNDARRKVVNGYSGIVNALQERLLEATSAADQALGNNIASYLVNITDQAYEGLKKIQEYEDGKRRSRDGS